MKHLDDEKREELLKGLSKLFNKSGIDAFLKVPDYILAVVAYGSVFNFGENLKEVDRHRGKSQDEENSCTSIKKKVEKFVDHSAGFPVTLRDVPMVYVREVWTPDVDYHTVHKMIVLALVEKPLDLTGEEIRFVRSFLGMSIEGFGNRFCERDVANLEKVGGQVQCLRDYIWEDIGDIKLLGEACWNGNELDLWSNLGWSRD